MKTGLPALVLIIFGIPFLMLTDLFPLHRYGMFAATATRPEIRKSFRLEIHTQNGWTNAGAGNPYFEKGYFPLESERAFGNPIREKNLADKIRIALETKPDSIRLIQSLPTQNDSIRWIFPAH